MRAFLSATWVHLVIFASNQYYSLQSLFIPIFIACLHFLPKDFLCLLPFLPHTFRLRREAHVFLFYLAIFPELSFSSGFHVFPPICFLTLLRYLHSAINPSDKPRILLLLVLHLPFGLHNSMSKICQTLVTLVLNILELFLIYAFSERHFTAGIIF